MVHSIAWRLATGKPPGILRQTGQVWMLGFLAWKGSFLHPQNIFDFVFSSTWVSMPQTSWYFCELSLMILISKYSNQSPLQKPKQLAVLNLRATLGPQCLDLRKD